MNNKQILILKGLLSPKALCVPTTMPAQNNNQKQLKRRGKNVILQMNIKIFLLLAFFVPTIGYSYAQTSVSHNLIKNKKIVIKNKASNKVLDVRGAIDSPGTQVWQFDYNGTTSQQFKLVEAGNGNFHILSENNFFLSLKSSGGVIGRSTTAIGTGSRILALDQKYSQKPTCATSAIVNCPEHQLWRIKPVLKDSQAFTIESVAFNTALQPQSNASGVSVSPQTNSEGSNQRWIIVEKNDLALMPAATQQEIAEFEDIINNQLGVGVLNGDTVKPFYFHHNKTNETIYKYKKKVHVPKLESITRSIDAWFPVEEIRKTICGRVKEYKQVTQDIHHNDTYNLDVDANLHIVPNRKFDFMLKNPRMESYAEGRYFKERFLLHCAATNCLVSSERKRKAEEKARDDVQSFLQKHKWEDIEVEFTPAMLGNPKDAPDKDFLRPINPMFSFEQENINGDVCAYGPWMWERIILKDLPHVVRQIADLLSEDYFNNEIHPANQIWFRKNNTLNLIAVVDQTGYFENPSNPSNNTEVHASGFNQRMRFHVAFRISDGIINKPLEYQVNGVGFKFTNAPQDDVAEIVLPFKYKGALRLTIRDNSFVRTMKTHRVFLDKVRTRPDGSVQGYLVVETEPITRRGGSINIFISNQ